MSRFEFIFVLISIILGLALTQLLSGMTRSIQKSERKFDFAHIFFSFAVVILLITVWWATFRWEHHQPWTFPDFALLCVYMSWFYVMTMILYPANLQVVPRFSEIRIRFYGAFIVYCLLEIPVMIVRDGTLEPWYYLPMMVHLVVLSGLGMLLRRDRFDTVLAGWICLVNIAWPFAARMTG